ncbi:MAG: hypothetical protein JST68_18550 [Bacteroidetes bacterium]|nr:hypothetical protein [Bacteroidota bacterium]
MKKSAIFLLLASFLSFHAFSQKDSTKRGKVGQAINKAGNTTAKAAVSATSAIKDKKYKTKEGPDGQTIYIDKNSHYYYVDGRGAKTYVKKSQLRDKQK